MYKKKILIYLFCLFFLFINKHFIQLENKILFKIENEIITSIDRK